MTDRERPSPPSFAEASHPCHHPGCKSDGLFGENVFFKPREGIAEIWRCHEHWKAREATAAAEPKFNQPSLAL